jgi:preprotein translocase subunit SecG
MYEILLVVYLLVALAVIGLVLVQQGKGASMGASFGAGASNTVFGSSGSGNFMTRATGILAAAFFVLSLVLGALSHERTKPTENWTDLSKPAAVEQVKEKVAEAPVSKDADVPN